MKGGISATKFRFLATNAVLATFLGAVMVLQREEFF